MHGASSLHKNENDWRQQTEWLRVFHLEIPLRARLPLQNL